MSKGKNRKKQLAREKRRHKKSARKASKRAKILNNRPSKKSKSFDQLPLNIQQLLQNKISKEFQTLNADGYTDGYDNLDCIDDGKGYL